jgi:hypothetical protein
MPTEQRSLPMISGELQAQFNRERSADEVTKQSPRQPMFRA